ncbi:hypothetical protein evm_000182 [Chilo suppressalis]|nr:hypothetical protein evm_000182 [Chilo suppressalis]
MRTVDPALWSKALIRKKKIGSRQRTIRRYGVFEGRVRASFCDAFREYVRHSTAPGLRYIVDIDARAPVRCCYSILMLCLVAWGTSAVIYVSVEYQNQAPLQIDFRGRTHDMGVAFPAVAICSNTLINKAALDAYTDYLNSKNKNKTFTRKMIRSQLESFGNLLTLISPLPDMDFMRFIYDKDPDFNVTKYMYDFSPKCSQMLVRCGWRGYAVQCSSLFAERPTSLGFCCVFNSRYHPADLKNQPHTLNLAGENKGLIVLVTENPNDAAISRRVIEGFDVLIFDGMQYPLLQSGLVRLLPVNRNESVFFPIHTHIQRPTDRLLEYNENLRRCGLNNRDGPRNERSSFAWCLIKCHRRTIAALCNCLPYNLMPGASDTTCTPEHLACLTKHKDKLLYYYPGKSTHPHLTKELQDSQKCTKCVPDCTRDQYTTVPYRTNPYFTKKLWSTTFTSAVSFENTSVLRFYYETVYHEVYDVGINVEVFEKFAKISCMVRLLVGVTLISVLEILFFLTIRWGYHFWRRSCL